MTASVELFSAAVRYADQGRPVFPCAARGKRPLTPRGLLDATADPATLKRWWTRWPDANVAIRTGRESRLVVLDVDGEAGAESLHELERGEEPLPRTASVVTPRGGEHFYFKHPGTEVRNSAGALGVGIDIRGDGGYALAPPSTGPNGRRYEPDERVPPAELPGWLQARVTTTQNGSQAVTPASEWLSMIRDGIPAGQRNQQLTRITGHLLRRYIDVDLAAALVNLINAHRCSPPLSAVEVDRIIESICAAELRRREARR